MLLAMPVSPAAAQGADTSDQTAERVSALTDPGVGFITTTVGWSVRLVYADSGEISGRKNIDRVGKIAYSSGSGFVVNPSGTIVTASHVIEPDEDQIHNYAANQIFFGGGLGYRLESNQSPYERYTISSNRFLNSLLQQCYSGVACSFKVQPTVTFYSPVQIAGASAPKGMPARVLKSTGFDDTDVAVIQVDGNNMPTVPLATTANNLTSGQPVTALGFAGSVQNLPTGVTEPTKAFGRVSSVRSAGSSRVVQVDVRIEGGMSGGPVVDNSGQVIGLTSFSFTEGTTRTQGFLRTVDDIKATISGSGATVARSDVDSAYAQGMNLFWGHHYTAALPYFQKVQTLYDGHPGAKAMAAQAQAKIGTAEDLPLEQPKKGGLPTGLLIGLVAAIVLIGAVVATLIVRRAHKVPAAPAGPAPQGWGQPNAPMANGPGPMAPPQNQPMAHMAPIPGPADLPAPADVPAGPPVHAELERTDPAPPVPVVVSAQPEPGEAATGQAEPAGEATVPHGAVSSGRHFCPECGNEQTGAGKFCGNCGHRFA
jgi:S1-C subfamily serine protease